MQTNAERCNRRAECNPAGEEEEEPLQQQEEERRRLNLQHFILLTNDKL